MYIPGNIPTDPKDIPAFLATELASLTQQLNLGKDYLLLETQYVAPKKLRAGMVVLADGTSWNPGSGAGYYGYYGGAWVKLG